MARADRVHSGWLVATRAGSDMATLEQAQQAYEGARAYFRRGLKSGNKKYEYKTGLFNRGANMAAVATLSQAKNITQREAQQKLERRERDQPVANERAGLDF